MSNRNRNKTDRLRQVLANETAKIISIEGLRDFHRAKIKASDRLGNSHHGSLPSNLEIERALISFQQTFIPDYRETIVEQRRVALAIMQWLQDYFPLLAGPVLEGTVGINNVINIHVSSDTVERVFDQLQNNGVQPEFIERQLKLNNEFINIPTIWFEYQNYEVEVLVFSLRQQHQQPKSKLQNRSMRRLNIQGVERLLNDMPD